MLHNRPTKSILDKKTWLDSLLLQSVCWLLSDLCVQFTSKFYCANEIVPNGDLAKFDKLLLFSFYFFVDKKILASKNVLLPGEIAFIRKQ